MTSAEPTPSAPDTPGDAALANALSVEHGVIYGYGMVSAHCAPEVNYLVSDALHQHRARRDQVVSLLTGRSATAPVAAAGYQLPGPLNDGEDAARLAVRMENDSAVAWRMVLEQAGTVEDRQFAVAALTASTVMGARWNRESGSWPLTETFPGGSAP